MHGISLLVYRAIYRCECGRERASQSDNERQRTHIFENHSHFFFLASFFFVVLGSSSFSFGNNIFSGINQTNQMFINFDFVICVWLWFVAVCRWLVGAVLFRFIFFLSIRSFFRSSLYFLSSNFITHAYFHRIGSVIYAHRWSVSYASVP